MKKFYSICLLLAAQHFYAQTEIDGLMMEKNNFCTGAIYEYSSWEKYWEGTFKRENLNFGRVSTQKISINGNYGITKKINFIFSVPYVITKASAGTMKGQEGFQDLSLTLKYLFYEKSTKNNSLSFYAIGGFSFPTSNYVADYLPLSIGLRSKTGTFRLMSDYQFGSLFATASGAYLKRSNIKIDRNTYFTDEMHYTNEVDMPDAISFNIRTGYRTQRVIAEAILDTWTTQKGGFDITTNNMPFPSNTMNVAKIGINTKYNLKSISGLSIIAGGNHVISGRNVGQSNSFYGGLFYIVDFKSKTAKTTNDEK
jgi:hypothetical protein